MELGVILLVIVVVVVVVGVLLYNGLVTKRNRVDEAVGQIEVQLKRRHDLIPNLVAAVKDYMGFEQEVLTRVTEARANAVAAGAQGTVTQQQVQAENALSGALRSLFAVVENYPRAEGERERPGPAGAADHDGEPDQLLAPALQRDGQRVQHDDPDHPLGPHRGPAGLHEAGLLRRRARGRPGPGRRAALTSARPGPPRPLRSRWPPRSTARPRRTGGTRSCWCWSSSPCWRVLGFAIGYGTTGVPEGGDRLARDLRDHRDRRLARRLLLGRPRRPRGVEGAPRHRGPGAPAAQRRPRADPRGGHAHAGGLPHRRHGAQRLRHRARPAARLDRGDDRASWSASTARSSRA